MQYRSLGRTGITISEIGFGAWGIGGGWGDKDDAQALDALRRAFDLGVTFYDTALGYGNGHSETLIGEVLAGWSGAAPFIATLARKIGRGVSLWICASSAARRPSSNCCLNWVNSSTH